MGGQFAFVVDSLTFRGRRCPSVAFWVKNLGDRTYYVSGLGNAGLGFLELILGLPRTFEVTVSGKF